MDWAVVAYHLVRVAAMLRGCCVVFPICARCRAIDFALRRRCVIALNHPCMCVLRHTACVALRTTHMLTCHLRQRVKILVSYILL